jgi:branched-chain amino acid transport system substrate-binding protein
MVTSGQTSSSRLDQTTKRHLLTLCMILALALVVTACGERDLPDAGDQDPAAQGPLRVGLLLDYTGALRNLGLPTEYGARLAADLVNQSGGVLGAEVELVTADGATDPQASVDAARRLIEEEGVTAIIGPLGSATALRVATEVTIPARVPIICPSATAPQLTQLDDDGFVFRSTLSDTVQGPVLAQLVAQQGIDRVSIIYRNDAYGKGLLSSFTDEYSGTIAASIAIEPYQDSYLTELRRIAGADSQALLAMTFAAEGEVYIKEAVENRLFSSFVFADAMAHQFLIDSVGAEPLEGTRGTLPRGGGRTGEESAQALSALFSEKFQQAPVALSFAAYDAALSIFLAAEQAGSISATAIRDALPAVTGGDGEMIRADDQPGVARALSAAREGKAINYDGFSCSMDFNQDGDLATGFVDVFEIRGGEIVKIDEVPFGSPELNNRQGD